MKRHLIICALFAIAGGPAVADDTEFDSPPAEEETDDSDTETEGYDEGESLCDGAVGLSYEDVAPDGSGLLCTVTSSTYNAGVCDKEVECEALDYEVELDILGESGADDTQTFDLEYMGGCEEEVGDTFERTTIGTAVGELGMITVEECTVDASEPSGDTCVQTLTCTEIYNEAEMESMIEFEEAFADAEWIYVDDEPEDEEPVDTTEDDWADYDDWDSDE